MSNQDVFLEGALLEEGRINHSQLEAARRYCIEQEVDLVDALILTEAISSHDIALAKAGICEAPFVDLAEYEVCFANTRLVPRAMAERYDVFPLFLIDDVLTLAMDDPLNLEAMDQVRQFARCEVDAVLCDRERLRPLIARAYSLSHAEDAHVEAQPPEAEIHAAQHDPAHPVVAAVNQLLADAADESASDVHINPDEYDLRLRYRIDGVLHERQGPPLSMHAGIVQRIKVMANLDLTQTRRPQDGKFRFAHDGVQIDVRVSTIPTVCGENVVLRLLSSSQVIVDFHELGEAEAEAAIHVAEPDPAQPVVAAVNQLLADAVDQGASDVHINPDEYVLRLRYRIDGVLQEHQGPRLSMHAGIVQRIKVMANLDLTQTRRPQDGKLRF
ncbi:MAG: ATPase, T2SS/T4P/T4SS family, partial [Planctomycetota bacterium]|nr:ATPase, T2SS/T4P/T4SS family [Planctomycetota bacterium]